MGGELIPIEAVEQKIFVIRGQKVMIDRDLAQLYGVETKYLNRQVKRNISRFPDEFMLKLTMDEKNELVTNWHRFSSLKHSVALPYAFTEHGVAMLATVLNSERAVKISIFIIRVFIQVRDSLSRNSQIEKRLGQIEARLSGHDGEIKAVIQTIKQLMAIEEKPKRKIGFS